MKRLQKLHLGSRLTVSLVAILLLLPIFVTFLYSFFSPGEIRAYMNTRNNYSSGSFMEIKLIPHMASLMQYYQMMVTDQTILRYFCNSMLYAATIVIGQLLILPALAYGLSCFRFRGRDTIAFSIVLLMVLPFQVTMVPSVLMLRRLNLLNTRWAIILPMVAVPFFCFLMRQFMMNIPKDMLEAAQIDSAGPLQCFLSIILPASKPVIGTMIALSFAESWNMVEQPLIYLRQSTELYPLSVQFGQLTRNISGIEFAGATLFILPALFVFLIFRDDIMEGIQVTDIK